MRIAFNIALVLSLLFLPWWAGAVIAVSACFIVDRFYEVMLYGILADALYGTKVGIYGFTHIATLFTLLIFVLASLIRDKLAW